jgi:hypothetical protein
VVVAVELLGGEQQRKVLVAVEVLGGEQQRNVLVAVEVLGGEEEVLLDAEVVELATMAMIRRLMQKEKERMVATNSQTQINKELMVQVLFTCMEHCSRTCI